MSGSNCHDLVAWQRAIDLVVSLYEVTRHFPLNGLIRATSDQIRGKPTGN